MAKAKFIERELKIEDAINEAIGEIQNLAEEMREAYDNTPESLQNDGVGLARGEVADNLENINEPDVPIELQNEKFIVKWQVKILSPSAMRKQSRSNRRYESVETLNQVIHTLEEIKDDKKATDEEKDAATNLIDEVQNIIDEAEAVEFPGMYG